MQSSLHCWYESFLIFRWWRKINFTEKLPFARDRMVECYFWVLGLYFEPQHSLARKILNQIFAFMITLDDIYDVYGTVEELVIFTDAIERLLILLSSGFIEQMIPLIIFTGIQINMTLQVQVGSQCCRSATRIHEVFLWSPFGYFY